MKQIFRLLAIFPHPDDESLGLGGTLAKYSAEGVETYLICATRGERGWTGPADEYPGLQNLGKIREAELKCASSYLGLKETIFLDYIDGDVDLADPKEIIAEIAHHIRRIQPHVVITFPLDGTYGHPDHIAISQFTSAALIRSIDSNFSDPDQLPPHQVPKYYHMVDSKNMVDALREMIGGLRMEVDGLMRSHFGWEEWAITTRIKTEEYFDTVWKAILCHQSQLSGFAGFLDLPIEDHKRLFSEGTFIRIYSFVNGGRKTETDLFEGLNNVRNSDQLFLSS